MNFFSIFLASSGCARMKARPSSIDDAEVLHRILVRVGPVGAGDPAADEDIRVDLGEIFGGDGSDMGRHHLGAERLDDRQIIDAAALEHVGQLRQRRLDHLDLVERHMLLISHLRNITSMTLLMPGTPTL